MISIPGALVDHATLNAWANPHLDKQFLIKPAQVTPFSGTRGLFRLPHAVYPTPDNSTNWMLYEYGQLDPGFLGMFGDSISWRKLSDIMVAEDLIVFPMLQHRMVLLDSVYVIRTDRRNLLFAVDLDRNRELFNVTSDFILRFYSNAFFATPEGSALDGIRCAAKSISADTDAASLISDYNVANYETRGSTWWFKNGYLIDKPIVSDVSVGDTLQYVWDSAGVKHFDVRLSDMVSFRSEVDGIDKLLMLTPEFIGDDFVYYDDAEFFVCSEDLDGKIIGAYYDRQSEKDLRQVTYRDWSFDATRINEAIFEHNGDIPYRNSFIRVYVRKMVNPTIDVGDGQYLEDLYLIDYSTRKKILAGGIGNFEHWHAKKLEASPFMKWLSSNGTQLTYSNMQNVYNYYGLQKALQLPIKASGGWKLPEMAKQGCFVLDFDVDGKLVNKHTYTEATFGVGLHSPGSTVKSILVYCGNVTYTAGDLDQTSARENDGVDIFDQERFYRLNAGTPWTVAREGIDYTYDSNTDTVNWSAIQFGTSKLKRSSRILTEQELEINYSELGRDINIFSNGAVSLSKFGFGRVDVWINGLRATEGLDYVVEGFKIHLTGREYVTFGIDPASNPKIKVQLVAHGLPSDKESGQFGFVVNNMVNHDDDVDLVRNRNYALFVGGKFTAIEDIWLAENYRGVSTFTPVSTEILEWREGTAYPEGTLINFDDTPYVAPSGGLNAASVFNPEEWTRIWTSSYYEAPLGSQDYVQFFIDGTVLKTKLIHSAGSELSNQPLIDVDIAKAYTLMSGLPLSTSYDNGKVYTFTGTSNCISRFEISKYSDTPAEATLTTSQLSALINQFMPQKTVQGVITIPKQHHVVSIYMRKVVDLLLSNAIIPDGTELSDAAVDYILRDWRDILDIDPVNNDSLDFRFIACYAHGELEPIQLNAIQVNFLARVNELYLDDRVLINRDFVIA